MSTTKPLALVQPLHPKPSATVALEIAVEALHDIASELTPLFIRFWQESGRQDIPLDPDWVSLLRLSTLGMLRVVTVREDGQLEGFLLNVVQPHLFYKSTAQGSTIAYWLNPIYRTGWFPIKLLRRNIEYFREWGCRRIFIAADNNFEGGRIGRIFERLGYEKHETHYAMVLP